MIRSLRVLFGVSLLCFGGSSLDAIESEAVSQPGIQRAQLLTDVSAITPGEKFTVALALDPLPGFHTYWRGPGIVGVATRIDWKLPEGFTAGPILWPPPEEVIMANIRCQGYERPALLLTEIQAPEKLPEGKVQLSARVAWMACTLSCNLGLADFTLKIPVAPPGSHPKRDEKLGKAFQTAREQAPKPTPQGWTFTPHIEGKEQMYIDALIPGLKSDQVKGIHFYCDDMQMDSDEPQTVTMLDDQAGKVRITLARTDYGPESPSALSGVLYSPSGWPGLDSNYVEISAHWPAGTVFK